MGGVMPSLLFLGRVKWISFAAIKKDPNLQRHAFVYFKKNFTPKQLIEAGTKLLVALYVDR